MARARNIKPSFFTNEELADLPAFDRLLFVGLWCLADREGRLEDRPRRIKIELFPGDTYDVAEGLVRLEQKGFIERYEAAGSQVISLPNFLRHQSPHSTEKDSELPDRNGFLTVNERVKGRVTPGAQRLVNAGKPSSSGLSNEPLTVNAPLSNGSETVNASLDNALIPDSLNPDYLNPDSLIRDQEHVQPGQAGQDALALEPTSGRGQGKTKPATPRPDPLEGFDEFYRQYPRRQKRADAEKAWRKLSPTDRLAAMQALPAHCANPDWLKDNGQFVPLPASWLNGKRWQDELDSAGAGQAPVDEIVDLYHELCPNLATITTMDPKRRSLINERWAENQVHQGLDFWRAFFETARSVPQLYHRGAMRAPYLDSMLERDNFRAIVEDRTNA